MRARRKERRGGEWGPRWRRMGGFRVEEDVVVVVEGALDGAGVEAVGVGGEDVVVGGDEGYTARLCMVVGGESASFIPHVAGLTSSGYAAPWTYRCYPERRT